MSNGFPSPGAPRRASYETQRLQEKALDEMEHRGPVERDRVPLLERLRALFRKR